MMATLSFSGSFIVNRSYLVPRYHLWCRTHPVVWPTVAFYVSVLVVKRPFDASPVSTGHALSIANMLAPP